MKFENRGKWIKEAEDKLAAYDTQEHPDFLDGDNKVCTFEDDEMHDFEEDELDVVEEDDTLDSPEDEEMDLAMEAAMPPMGQRKRIEFEDDIVKVYDGNKEIYAGTEDYEPMQDEDWKWDNTNKYYKFGKYIKVCCESSQKNEDKPNNSSSLPYVVADSRLQPIEYFKDAKTANDYVMSVKKKSGIKTKDLDMFIYQTDDLRKRQTQRYGKALESSQKNEATEATPDINLAKQLIASIDKSAKNNEIEDFTDFVDTFSIMYYNRKRKFLSSDDAEKLCRQFKTVKFADESFQKNEKLDKSKLKKNDTIKVAKTLELVDDCRDAGYTSDEIKVLSKLGFIKNGYKLVLPKGTKLTYSHNYGNTDFIFTIYGTKVEVTLDIDDFNDYLSESSQKNEAIGDSNWDEAVRQIAGGINKMLPSLTAAKFAYDEMEDLQSINKSEYMSCFNNLIDYFNKEALLMKHIANIDVNANDYNKWFKPLADFVKKRKIESAQKNEGSNWEYSVSVLDNYGDIQYSTDCKSQSDIDNAIKKYKARSVELRNADNCTTIEVTKDLVDDDGNILKSQSIKKISL